MSELNTSNQIKATSDYLKRMEAGAGPCLTFVLSTPNGGKDVSTHRKRLEAEIDEVRSRYADTEHGRKLAEEILPQVTKAFEDDAKWSGEYESICLHVSPDRLDVYKLEQPQQDFAHLSNKFHYKPAARSLQASMECLALILTWKDPKLYHRKGSSIHLVGEVELPESVYEFSEDGAIERGERAHIRRGGTGDRSPQGVAQGVTSTESPRDLNQPIFLREVAHALSDVEETKRLPLVVIGDTQLLSEFAKTYDHPGGEVHEIADLESHPDEQALLDACDELAGESLGDQREKVLEAVGGADPRSDQVSDNLQDIYEAAKQGRVQLCVLAEDEDAWCIETDEGSLQAIDPAESLNSFDALDRIFVETATKDGAAVFAPKEKLPTDKLAMAVLRW